MHPRTRELLTYLDDQRAVLRAAFDRVPPAVCARRPSPESWSPAGIVEHLAIVETGLGGRFALLIAEARRKGLGPDPDVTPVVPTLNVKGIVGRVRRIQSAPTLAPTGLHARDAWAALEHAGIGIRDVLAGSDGLALGTISMPHPSLGELSLYQWFAFVAAHEGRHAAQIDEALASFGLSGSSERFPGTPRAT